MYTLAEIRNKFNLQYNNINSGAAPGVDDYEISLYLTQAYKEVVYNSYSGNTKDEAVDDSERMKSLLRPLTKTKTITGGSLITETSLYPQYITTRVVLPTDIWFILKAHIKSNTLTIPILPVLQDEMFLLIRNPYKRPNEFRAWRIDEATTEYPSSIVIISESAVTSFVCTYLEKPTPIILSNLSDILPGLSIENITVATLPAPIAANIWLTDMVINRAVELASRDYKENTLNTRLALNARVE